MTGLIIKIIVLIEIFQYKNVNSMNNNKKKEESSSSASLLELIKTLKIEEKNKILINNELFELNELIDYAIEYPKMNLSNYYQKLDKNIVMITSTFQQLEKQNEHYPVFNGFSSSSQINKQTDILIKFNSEIIFINQIYKISICCNQHNVVGYTLNVNAKKYKAIALTSNSKFTEIFFMENEKNIKIKSNVITIPFYNLYEKQNKKLSRNTDTKLLVSSSSKNDENTEDEVLYYLNSLLVSDIVTSDDGPWSNMFIKIQLCPSKSVVS
jgi:hypothetical protein